MSLKFNTPIGIVLLVVVGLFSSYSLAKETDERGFDYSGYAAVLKTFVDEKAMVNYSELKAHPQQLEAFVSALGRLDRSRYEQWSEKDKIAFWLNAYNGLTLKVIIDNYPIKASFLRSRIYPKNSIRQISGVWDKIAFDVMGRKLTLGHIEHKILRVEFNEPRIHAALVCAAMGCPPLRHEPYTGAKLDEQLDDQARRFLANPVKLRIDRSSDTVYLSPIFKWFAEDFVEKYAPQTNIGTHNKSESAVLSFVASYLPEADKKYVLAGKYRIKYLEYDWSLNKQPAKNSGDKPSNK
ncbi:MAG: hypothetical protein A2Z25_18015 [Planctomycetes bacterium RBG_16_55_9]|nr:MAG: hypothetical protein A2Z25_18015 [Planctomycetes bacterium RBG_16_55_9]